MFVSFTIFRLKGIREKSPRYVSFVRHAGAFLIVALIGYVSTIPSLMKYYDSTYTKFNTLTENSQEVISKLKGEITITTYVNIFGRNSGAGLPRSINSDLGRYDQYRRFKPDIKMKYKYYYALPIQEHVLNNFNKRNKGLTVEESLEKICKTYKVNKEMFKPAKDFIHEIDLESELNRFVRKIETEDGKVSYLRIYDDSKRFPNESQKTAAFKKLLMELPLVGFVKGHGERGVNDFESRSYSSLAKQKPFRYALINNGFDVTECELSVPVDKNIDILVIAESRTAYSEEEVKNLNDFIDRGGNLIIAADRKRQEVMNPLVERFGVKFMEGQVVEYNKGYTQDLVTSEFTPAGKKITYQFDNIVRREGCVTMEGAVGILHENTGDFKVTPVLVSDTMKNMPVSNDPELLKQLEKAQKARKDKDEKEKENVDPRLLEMMERKMAAASADEDSGGNYIGSWNELKSKDFIDDIAVFNPEQGETGGAITTALALTRKVGDKEQRIMILGDADCFSNGEFSRRRAGINAQNFGMATGMFFWLSNNEVPIDVRRPEHPDNKIKITDKVMPFWNIIYKFVFPALLALAFLLIWLRRKGR